MLEEVPDVPAAPDRAASRTGLIVGRTVQVLRALAQVQHDAGRQAHLREVTSATDMDSSTVCRYLRALAATEEPAVRQPSRGTYELVWNAPSDGPTPQPSQRVQGQLTQLQVRTGQIALLFHPFYLDRHPQRVCAERAWGPHSPVVHDDLDIAPLEADAPGLVIRAGLHDRPRTRELARRLDQIRAGGHAIGPAPVETHVYIAAPVMRGSTVAGSVAVMSPRTTSATARARCIQAVMDTAGAMSLHLTGQPRMHITA
ncbi:hypothetical protein AB0C96_35710 [Streptomyces sp. NPDC048506]|uniref:hypothetical protein n=1 Tax=Streptomyces sp. NPDC048506 TaxID=3155028 RepID=UPI003437EB98